MSPPSNALKSRVNNHSAKGRSSSDRSPQLINQIPAVSVPLCAVELSSGYCPTKGLQVHFFRTSAINSSLGSSSDDSFCNSSR